MQPAARISAAIECLDVILDGEPAEKVLTNWARGHRFAGSGDRAAIRDLVYDALRCRRSFAWLGGDETGRGLMIGRLRALEEAPATLFTGQGHAPAPLTPAECIGQDLQGAPVPVRHDCPDWLLPVLTRDHADAALPILTALQSRAGLHLRANTARATREDAMAALAIDAITSRPHPLSATAIEVIRNPRRVQSSQAYLSGLVEVQDAASQALVDRLLPLVQGRSVLDYCAGGGGKALALLAGGAAHVTAHDADPRRMADIPARAARAGVEIAMTAKPKGRFDMVLCDAPCSGSGAWRRQPGAKWRFSPARLDALTVSQDAILDAAMVHVAPTGYLAYATCSLIAAENEDRATAFLVRHPGWVQSDTLRLTPLDGGDGFFLAVFHRS